jgi:hypothetical protein
MRKYLKSLLLSSPVFKFIRRKLQLTFDYTLVGLYDQCVSSDIFIWRTDGEYKTVYKCNNILKEFYNRDSLLYVVFYDELGNTLFDKWHRFDDNSFVLKIDHDLIGFNGYGTFMVFNLPIDMNIRDIHISNRCYVGYGTKDRYSMLHGNLIAKMVTGSTLAPSDFPGAIKPAVKSRLGKFKYYIQESLNCDAENELMLTNPTHRLASFRVGNTEHVVKPNGCVIIKLETFDNPVSVESDFSMPRPIIFTKMCDLIDVHHG